ncbi:MAG: hypothetical protein Q9170_006366 [Blastenia crenularia]
MSIREIHALDCSPTQTPAQTRSTSPVRGSNIPHLQEEATEFVSQLTSMVESTEPNGMAKDSGLARASTENNKPLPMHHPPITAASNLEKRLLNNDIHATTSTDKATTVSPVVNKMAGLAKVNAIDGSSSIPVASKVQILLLYFLLNLGLTLYNKAVMIMFPFPFLLTALHAASGMIGTQALLTRRVFTLKYLSGRDTVLLSAFSILYTANIAVSNASLAMVTIPFHQTVRALTPVFTVVVYRMAFASIYATATYISLIPIIIGVMLASYGDLSATTLGFFVTLLGTALAAIKTIATNRLQTAGLRLSALELLYRMSPIACVQSLIVGYVHGEFDRFEPRVLGVKGLLVVLANGVIAFGLNVASFEANKRSGALTMTIAANVKQVLTVMLSVLIWRIPISVMNASGIALTLVGGAWYGRVEVMSRAAVHPEGQLEEGLPAKPEPAVEAERRSR